MRQNEVLRRVALYDVRCKNRRPGPWFTAPMHAYATDSAERTTIPMVLGVISIGLAIGFDQGMSALGLKAPWWLDTPAVMGFYGLLHSAFDKTLWKWKHRIALSSIPDLNGTWVGTVVSEFDHGLERQVVVRIKQTWLAIRIELQSEYSSSLSHMAALHAEDAPRPGLMYSYSSEPRPGAPATMETHSGTSRLRINPSGTTMEGDYYSGRGRKNIGTLKLHRVSHGMLDWKAAIELANTAR